jgi:hypothetical protein
MSKISSRVRGHFVAYLALFFALGGTSIAAVNAVPRNSVGTAQLKNGAVTKQKIAKKTLSSLRGARGPAGATGAAGAAGAPGAKGDKGDTGPQGLIQTKSVIGAINTIAGNSGAFVFAGPQATLTTTADQAISAVASGSLGVSAGTASVDVYVCYQNAGSGAVTQFGNNPGNLQAVDVTTSQTLDSSSGVTVPGAGTWKVGLCIDDFSATALDNNDWESGVFQVLSAGSFST